MEGKSNAEKIGHDDLPFTRGPVQSLGMCGNSA